MAATGEWTRPENVPYPSVWSKFEGKKEINGVKPKFWIQDLPESDFDTVVASFIPKYLQEELLCQYSNLSSDKEAVQEILGIAFMLLQQKLTLACYMENPKKDGAPILVAVNCTCVTSKHNKPDIQLTREASGKVLSTAGYVESIKDCFDLFKADHFLTARGLYVLPEYRGLSIGVKMLEAREPLCKAVGLKGTATGFSSKAAQGVAEKAGFKVLVEVAYEELGKMDPMMNFPGIEKDTKTYKFMYKQFN